MSGKKIETESGSAKAQRGGIFRPAVLALAIVVVTLVAAAGGFFFGRAGSESADAHLPILGTAPSYELTNQLGQKVSSKTFLGKIQVVTFVDPYCTDFCPLIAVNLANFAASFRASPLGDKVVFVAFNVDPWQTGVPQMRGFLREFGWNPKTPDLEFLTGSVTEMKQIVRQGFHVAFERVPNGPGDNAPVSGTPGHLQIALPNPLAEKAAPRYDIIHNDTIEIVDGKGRIRKIFDEGTRVSDRQLMRAIRALLSTTR